MPAIRVLYVEDDPTLRSIMTEKLKQMDRLTIVECDGSTSALARLDESHFDVMMLDIALGPNSLSGIELAHHVRRTRPDLGVVFYSQHAETATPMRVDDYYMGWSTVSKSATVNTQHLAEILIASARGYSRLEAVPPKPDDAVNAASNLSPRQREIMGLIAQGQDANKVAQTLGLASITIRAELSKIYKILIPQPEPGTDLRTMAVLRYLRATRTLDAR